MNYKENEGMNQLMLALKAAGGPLANEYISRIKKGENPIQDLIELASTTCPDLSFQAKSYAMQTGLWEWDMENAKETVHTIYTKLKGEGKGQEGPLKKFLMDGEYFDSHKDADLIGSLLFLDEDIAKEFGYDFGALYRCVIQYDAYKRQELRRHKRQFLSSTDSTKKDEYMPPESIDEKVQAENSPQETTPLNGKDHGVYGADNNNDNNQNPSTGLEDHLKTENSHHPDPIISKGLMYATETHGGIIYGEEEKVDYETLDDKGKAEAQKKKEVIIHLRKLIKKKASRDSLSVFKEDDKKRASTS